MKAIVFMLGSVFPDETTLPAIPTLESGTHRHLQQVGTCSQVNNGQCYLPATVSYYSCTSCTTAYAGKTCPDDVKALTDSGCTTAGADCFGAALDPIPFAT